MFCTSCGNQLKEGQKFCSKCGKPSKAASAESVPATPSADAQELARKQADAEQQRLADAQRLREQNEASARAQAEKTQREAEERKRQEEAERRLELAKAEEEKQRLEEQRKKAEAEHLTRLEAEKAAQERIIEQERKRLEEMQMPLPDSILLDIRTILFENGAFNQIQIDDIYRKTRAAGIPDERTKLQLTGELERFEKRAAASVTGSSKKEEIKKKEEPKKKRKLAGLFWTIGIFLFLGLLIGMGFVFRSQVLDTMDGWGLQTTALRGKLEVQQVQNVPVVTDTLPQILPVEQEDAEELQSGGSLQNEEDESEPIEEVLPKAIVEEKPVSQPQQTSAVKPKPAPRPIAQAQPQPISKPTVYTVVDRSPEYPGGNNALQNYIDRSILYPPQARREDLMGTVYLRYVVKADGSIGEVEITRGAAPSLDAEAIRVIKSIRGFNPGYKDGKAVSTYQSAKVRFML